MELKLNVDVDNICPTIEFNYAELNKEITESLVKYDNPEVNESTFKSAKEDRARINKVIKALKDERKSIKDKLLEPMTKFSSQIDELVGKCEKAASAIDSGIKRIEDEHRKAKRNEIYDYIVFVCKDRHFDEQIEQSLIVWMDGNAKWFNVTSSITEIKLSIVDKCNAIERDLATIKSTFTDAVYLKMCATKYHGCLDLGLSIQWMNDYKATKEKVSTQMATPPPAPTPTVSVPVANEQKYELNIIINGTMAQMNALKKFLEDNHFDYLQLGNMSKVK